MSAPHAHALIELLEAPLTVSNLAQRLSIDRTNVSRLCARMEAQGELERATHPKDGRALSLQLTAKGEHIARMVEASSASHFERVIANLGDDVEQVVQALHLLSDAMRKAQR